MPPSNRRRQSQDAQLWRGSPKMEQRSTLFSRTGLGRRNTEDDAPGTRNSRARRIVSRADNEIDSDSDDDLKDGPGDLSDDDSDDNDDDKIGDSPQKTTRLPTPSLPTPSSSGSVVTLTARPNPTKTTTSLMIMTTTPISQLSSTSTPLSIPVFSAPPSLGKAFPVQQGKEEGDDDHPDPGSPITSQFIPTVTTGQLSTGPTLVPVASDTVGDSDDGPKHKWYGDKGPQEEPQGVLNPTAEHLLIAAGAIGAFILFCFIGWIIYRVLKRTKGQGIGISGGMGPIDNFYEKQRGSIDNRTLYMSNEAPPRYEQGGRGTMQSGNFYGPIKAYPSGPGSIARSVASNSEAGTLRQLPDNNPPLASIINQYIPGNGGASNNSDINMTMRSQVTQPYYNEPDLPRQPETFNAPKRAGTRASEISSISSGFGDGDIIIPPSSEADKSGPVPDEENPGARDSWMSRPGERRETVYTEASEDRPARFRSITSWVNQQAGRAKRAGSRARERGEVPVMPAIPGQISATRQTAYR
ncbi:hypothetical protein F4813DRAFT_291441 [Daldinia decipiens]|uniref:uncharacterized protein n=1 Tax=Daldinia decipiens TaxID=326647 RepID=UPI0020C474F6|nr:uncharacterized protein F4813DRAFT_291441 [Daldinia decipiens]KAI1660335.1 hypothetical protein F4813DRAFT_291441 [Daldinia decipiens]